MGYMVSRVFVRRISEANLYKSRKRQDPKRGRTRANSPLPAKEEASDKHVQAKPFQPFNQQQENDFLKTDGKILSEERITTGVNGKIFGGVQRILQGTKGTLRQEVVYLGRTLGDPASYPPGEKERMLTEARRLLFDLVGQDPNK
jgi:hypothetical protein